MSDADPEDLLAAAHAGAARCLCHGHRFDEDTEHEPVVVEKVDGKPEVWCRGCADHYGAEVVAE